MAEKETWDDFISTGKIMDYLQYKGCVDSMTNLSDITSGLMTAGNIPFSERYDKGKQNQNTGYRHEGFDYTNRDGDSILSD